MWKTRWTEMVMFFMSIKELLRLQYHCYHEDFKIIFWASLLCFIFLFVSQKYPTYKSTFNTSIFLRFCCVEHKKIVVSKTHDLIEGFSALSWSNWENKTQIVKNKRTCKVGGLLHGFHCCGKRCSNPNFFILVNKLVNKFWWINLHYTRFSSGES